MLEKLDFSRTITGILDLLRALGAGVATVLVWQRANLMAGGMAYRWWDMPRRPHECWISGRRPLRHYM